VTESVSCGARWLDVHALGARYHHGHTYLGSVLNLVETRRELFGVAGPLRGGPLS